jgi:hypothetical protein
VHFWILVSSIPHRRSIDYIAPALDPRTKNLFFLQNETERDAVWKHIEDLAAKTKMPDQDEPESVITNGTNAVERLLTGCGVQRSNTKY